MATKESIALHGAHQLLPRPRFRSALLDSPELTSSALRPWPFPLRRSWDLRIFARAFPSQPTRTNETPIIFWSFKGLWSQTKIQNCEVKCAKMCQESQRSPLNFASGTVVAGVVYQDDNPVNQLLNSFRTFVRVKHLEISSAREQLYVLHSVHHPNPPSSAANGWIFVVGTIWWGPKTLKCILENEALFHLLHFTVGQSFMLGHTSKNCYPLTTPKSTYHLMPNLREKTFIIWLQGSDPPWCTATAAWVKGRTGLNR